MNEILNGEDLDLAFSPKKSFSTLEVGLPSTTSTSVSSRVKERNRTKPNTTDSTNESAPPLPKL